MLTLLHKIETETRLNNHRLHINSPGLSGSLPNTAGSPDLPYGTPNLPNTKQTVFHTLGNAGGYLRITLE